jgi:SAM-dependent methyltransferase
MPMDPSRFYDDLADSYHLIFEDWEASIARQASQLSALIAAEWGDGVKRIADVACGIGTQAIGLSSRGFEVTASDLSARSVERARREAQARGLSIAFDQGDMRDCHARLGSGLDLVIACDNAIPHLLNDADILRALRQMHACLRPGGGLLISVRDYAREPRGRGLLKPHGTREIEGSRVIAFQVWDFEGEHYDLALYFVIDPADGTAPKTEVYRSRYYAVPIERLCLLLAEAGFTAVRRIDEGFYQPILVGTRR